MAYNFLDLTNELQRRLNEVELTSSTFPTARGQHALSKDSVNSAIQHINQEEFQWPWNHSEKTQTLTAGVVRYDYPTDAKTVDFNSFRIKANSSLNVATTKLEVLQYEEYLSKFVDAEYTSSTTVRDVPKYVVRTPNREIIVVPSPKDAYELVYEYYTYSTNLSTYTDVPAIPEQYRHVVLDGASYYAYLFRGDAQQAQLSLVKFEQGIKNMRSLHINRTDYVRDTRVAF